MKKLLPRLAFGLIIFGFSFQAFAQKILVPKKVNDKFGLVNEQGKFIVAPKYDHINWLEGKYFSTSNKVDLSDTLVLEKRNILIRKQAYTKGINSGLIYNGKTILQSEPFESYYVFQNAVIVAKYDNGYQQLTQTQYDKYGKNDKIFSIFNISGKNIYPENFRNLSVLDTFGRTKNNKPKLIAFSAIHYDRTESIFVFDVEKQIISEWLIKKLEKVRIKSQGYGVNQHYEISYTDENYDKRKGVLTYNGKFLKIVDLENGQNEESGYGVSEITSDRGGYYDVAKPPMEEKQLTPIKQPTMYLIQSDTLFFQNENGVKTRIDIPNNATMIYQSKNPRVQRNAPIFKFGSQFGLVVNNQLNKADYDSLIYFGNDYMTGKIINGKMKFAVIDAQEKMRTGFDFDSIGDFPKSLRWQYENNILAYKRADQNEDFPRNYNPKDYPYTKRFHSQHIVYNNGKMGLMGPNYQIIVPVVYDEILMNGLNYSRPAQTDFLILRNGNFYGAGKLKYDSKTQTNSFEELLPVKMKYIPTNYYPNYFGIKNFKLFELNNEQTKVEGYVDENGKDY